MDKIPSSVWHEQNGARARQINELLQELSVNTGQQYGRAAIETKLIKEIVTLFLMWRDRMDNAQFNEIRDRDQRSFWFGSPRKFDKGGDK